MFKISNTFRTSKTVIFQLDDGVQFNIGLENSSRASFAIKLRPFTIPKHLENPCTANLLRQGKGKKLTPDNPLQ